MTEADDHRERAREMRMRAVRATTHAEREQCRQLAIEFEVLAAQAEARARQDSH
jgi:hypothetical protein